MRFAFAQVDKIVKIIKGAKHIIFFTGAGIRYAVIIIIIIIETLFSWR
jgi:hypothetical protein